MPRHMQNFHITAKNERDDSMTPYQRIFGTGPRGLLFGVLSIVLALSVDYFFELPPMHGSQFLSNVSLVAGLIVTASIVFWSVVALRPSQRGRELVISGPFHYVRHPLYAAFLIGFNFGLAMFLDGWIFIAWAVFQYPLWHLNISGEERLMIQQFGQAYRDYSLKTGRFLPRLIVMRSKK